MERSWIDRSHVMAGRGGGPWRRMAWVFALVAAVPVLAGPVGVSTDTPQARTRVPAGRLALGSDLAWVVESMHDSMDRSGSGAELDVIVRVRGSSGRALPGPRGVGVRPVGAGAGGSAARAAAREALAPLIEALSAIARPSPSAEGGSAVAEVKAAGGVHPLWTCQAVACRLRVRDVLAIARRRDVAMVYLDRELRLLSPIDGRRTARAGSAQGVAWGVLRVRAPELWRRGITGEGVTIGHIDSGVAPHPRLAGRIAAWRDFTRSRSQSTPTDGMGHGTHTAGTLVGAGGLGVAPGARLVVARVFDRRGKTRLSALLGAMEWMLTASPRPRIVACAWGMPVRGSYEGHDLLHGPLLAWREAGLIGVFASGNEGPGTLDVPAAYPEALAVGASDGEGRQAGFASEALVHVGGRTLVKPDLWAPGVDVPSTWPDRGVATLSGTSMACPHVAGVAALLWQAAGQASDRSVIAALRGSRPRGVVDAVASLERLAQRASISNGRSSGPPP